MNLKYLNATNILMDDTIEMVDHLESLGIIPNSRMGYYIWLVTQLDNHQGLSNNKEMILITLKMLYNKFLEHYRERELRIIRMDSFNLLYDLEIQVFQSAPAFKSYFSETRVLPDFQETQKLNQSLNDHGLGLKIGQRVLIQGEIYSILGTFGFNSDKWILKEDPHPEILRLQDLQPLAVKKDFILIDNGVYKNKS